MSYALNSLLAANTLDAQFQIIQENPELLDSGILAQLEKKTEQLWTSGKLEAAEELWRIQRLLERVRQFGIEATRRMLTGSGIPGEDEDLLLDRSRMPLRTPHAVHQLLQALATRDVTTVMQALKIYAEPLRPPTAPAMLRQTGRYSKVYGEGSPLLFERAAQLLEEYAVGNDVVPFIEKWWPKKEDALKDFNPMERAALEYSSAETWEEAYKYLSTHQAALFSENVLTYLNSLLRDMWASEERGTANLVWRRLRVLMRSQIEGMDSAFMRYVWNPLAEQIWESTFEVGLMEAACKSPAEMGPLVFLMVALTDGDQKEAEDTITQNRSFFRQPWVAYFARYMAEIDRAGYKETADIWDKWATWFESL